jgi:hypothetical protein
MAVRDSPLKNASARLPRRESIRSILPLCNEVVVNVGASEDEP